MSERAPTPHRPRVLITGATGFIGGRLARAALAAGFQVRALVRSADAAAGLEDTELFVGDLTRPDSLAGIEADVDLVVHGAAMLGKWGTRDDSMRALNVDGSVALLERFAARPDCRYFHLSAGGVTGPVPSRSVDETYECRPATDYERTKLAAEQAVLARAPELGIGAIVLRPTFTYGPGDPHKLALFRAVKKGRYAYIGDGNSVVTPVFIDDLVRGILLAFAKARPGEVYILGGERPVTKVELITTIASALGVSPPRMHLPRWLASLAARTLEPAGQLFGFEPILTRSRVMMMGDNFGYGIAKARSELGYFPAVGLEEGIRMTVEAYRQLGHL